MTRIALVVLVIIAVAFAVTAFSGARRSSSDDGAPQAKADGSYDQDSVAAWDPSTSPASKVGFFAAYAPRLKLDDPVVALGPGGVTERDVPAAPARSRLLSMAGDTRNARIVITKGAGVMHVTYACSDGEGRQCPQTICLCSPGAVFTGLQVLACPKAWREKRFSGAPCTKKTAEASLMIYPDEGQLAFAALGSGAVEAEVQ